MVRSPPLPWTFSKGISMDHPPSRPERYAMARSATILVKSSRHWVFSIPKGSKILFFENSAKDIPLTRSTRTACRL